MGNSRYRIIDICRKAAVYRLKENKLMLVLLLVMILAGDEAAVATQAVVRVTGLRCEYLETPLGIDRDRPRLSWELKSDRREVLQKTYQILAASGEELLKGNKGDLWDSGKVRSGQSNQVEYQGRRLRPRQQCFWKVRVWDQDGRVSRWSEPALWAKGLPAKSDWQGQWIGWDHPQSAGNHNRYLPCPYLRREFTLSKRVKRAVVYVTAAGVYELYINGKRVGEDYFRPGWTEYDKRMYYQSYEVTGMLKGGAVNAMGAILGDGWYGLHHHGRGKLRLLAQMHVEYADGTEELIATDQNWKATNNGPILMSDMYNGESYDGRKKMDGWSKAGFDESDWKAVVVGLAKGEDDLWVEVTEKVKQAVEDGGVSIDASNDNFGDPLFGVQKYLKVEYKLDGQTYNKIIAEGKTLRINKDKKQDHDLQIIKAYYGADSHNLSDVSQTILQSHPGEPVRKVQEIKPVSMNKPEAGVFVYDMGQNFSGWVRLTVKGEAGTKVVMRFAERLNPDGTIYTANLRGAKCTDTYIVKGTGKEQWEPRFTFHGFQYVEVTGYPGRPGMDAITGVVLHSDVQLTSSFECSNEMLNKLYNNIVWGQRSNYLEVPTDCPQRDERLGWSGDAQVFVGTGVYVMDVGSFYTAWMNTFNDSQDGKGDYPNYSPAFNGPKYVGPSAGWGDAGVICPWVIYQTYGDKRMIERHWEGMVRWIEYLTAHSQNYLRPSLGFGDWLSIKADTPKDVIATAYYAYVTGLMAKMAEATGKKTEAQQYEELFGRIRHAFNEAYVNEQGKVKGDTQTCYLMALRFDLLDEHKRQKAEKYLIERIKEKDWHLSTGFLGVNLLLPVLSDIGQVEVAYRLLQNQTYPSWGYPIRNGATTIWEHWNSWTQEDGFQNPKMNSFNHYAYGSCGEWMFKAMAGIDTEGPGYKRIIIRPRPGGGITYVKAHYDSIHGRIVSRWEVKDDAFTLRVTIPVNTSAKVYVPTMNARGVTESGMEARQAESVRFLKMDNKAAVYEVGSGDYKFESQINCSSIHADL